VAQFSWSYNVLDISCGTGLFDPVLRSRHPDCVVMGMDISEQMTMSEAIRTHYRSPIHIGPMEELILSMEPVDHVVCFSAFQYVYVVTFIAALSQMFLLAGKSVSFDVPRHQAGILN
jgi:predicted TPR repeat methyltransferase